MVIVFYNKITYALFSLQFMKTDKINLHVCDDFSSKELGDKNHFHFAFIGTYFPGGSEGKESTCNPRDRGSIPGSVRFPWRREWQPTPVFLPGEFHGQRSLVGYSSWGHKESDMTERLTLQHFQSRNL